LLGRFGWQFQLGFARCFFGCNTFRMSAGTGTRNCILRVGACWTAKLVFDFDQAPAKRMSAKMPASKKEVSECPADAMMRVMDGRWKGTILWRLQDGPRRTSELKRSIPGITERMLIRHLQELVADGIVKRNDKKTIPPCVYYSLSSYGRTLGPVVQMMCNWGRSHLKRLARPSVR
jgi:DNA-binding HxlR family transcriptional regulator